MNCYAAAQVKARNGCTPWRANGAKPSRKSSYTIIYFLESRCYAQTAGSPVRNVIPIHFIPRVFYGLRSWRYCWDWWKYRASGISSPPRAAGRGRGGAGGGGRARGAAAGGGGSAAAPT